MWLSYLVFFTFRFDKSDEVSALDVKSLDENNKNVLTKLHAEIINVSL